jgi:hypothetical protein
MKRITLLVQIFLLLIVPLSLKGQQAESKRKLHIIIIGAHPDDPDKVGGTAYKWASMGHDVMMVSLPTVMQAISQLNLQNWQRSGERKPAEPVKLLV